MLGLDGRCVGALPQKSLRGGTKSVRWCFTTEVPSWGHKVSEKMSLIYPHEGPWVVLLSPRLFLTPHLETDIQREIRDHLRLSSGNPMGLPGALDPFSHSSALRPLSHLSVSTYRGTFPVRKRPLP